MRLMPQNAIEEDAANVSAVDLVVFAQTLQGEGMAPYARQGVEAIATEAELQQREQACREQEQQLLSRLLVQFKRRARLRKTCLRAFALTGGLALLSGVAMMFHDELMNLLLAPFAWMAALSLVIMGVGTWLHGQMAMLVAHIPNSDVRAIGPLLEALRYADMGDMPQLALKELLPQLEPGDAVLFTDAHRHALHLALDDPNTDVVILLLKALEKIGDGRSIGAVKKLANGGGRARIDPQVLYAAQHCLPLLEAHSVYDVANQTLLRASAMQADTGAELLRVAQQPCNEPAYELLHPIQETAP